MEGASDGQPQRNHRPVHLKRRSGKTPPHARGFKHERRQRWIAQPERNHRPIHLKRRRRTLAQHQHSGEWPLTDDSIWVTKQQPVTQIALYLNQGCRAVALRATLRLHGEQGSQPVVHAVRSAFSPARPPDEPSSHHLVLPPGSRVALGVVAILLAWVAASYASATYSVTVLAPGAACKTVSPSECLAQVSKIPDTALVIALLVAAAIAALMALTGFVWTISIGGASMSPAETVSAKTVPEERVSGKEIRAINVGAPFGVTVLSRGGRALLSAPAADRETVQRVLQDSGVRTELPERDAAQGMSSASLAAALPRSVLAAAESYWAGRYQAGPELSQSITSIRKKESSSKATYFIEADGPGGKEWMEVTELL